MLADYGKKLLLAFAAVSILILLTGSMAVAAEEARVSRILTDETLFNKEVVVTGTVEEIETMGEGTTRGRFRLRDYKDGATIVVRSDNVPAPGPDIRTFTALVKKDGNKDVYLWHVDSGPTIDPIYIIAGVFLLIMGFLIYYLLRSDKQLSVSVNAPHAAAQPMQQPEMAEADSSEAGPAPVHNETLDSRGALVVEASANQKLVGQRRSVALRGGKGLLGREVADINFDDATFSSKSAMIKDDTGTRSLVIQNIKKGRKITLTSSNGDKTVLAFNEEIVLESGDIIGQENSDLKLRYESGGPQQTRDA